MTCKVLVAQPKPHQHDLPEIFEVLKDARGRFKWGGRTLFLENDIVECACGQRFVLRRHRSRLRWEPLRWRHRTAHRLLREADAAREAVRRWGM